MYLGVVAQQSRAVIAAGSQINAQWPAAVRHARPPITLR
jgi:hypothetical protein